MTTLSISVDSLLPTDHWSYLGLSSFGGALDGGGGGGGSLCRMSNFENSCHMSLSLAK